ncbi:MAG: NADPH-dependent FMN reductase [Actinomycetota bacterium]
MSNPSPLRLGAIIGSLRAGSFHRIIFENAAEVVSDDVTLIEIPIEPLPFFNEDLEGPDGPAEIHAFQAAVAAVDGLVFFSPEYNGGVPAVTKNAVDWASRPRGDAPIAGKPVMVVGATPGRHEVANVRDALSYTARSAGGRVHERSLGIASITRRLDDRRCHDDVRDEVRAALADFVEFVRRPSTEGDG